MPEKRGVNMNKIQEQVKYRIEDLHNASHGVDPCDSPHASSPNQGITWVCKKRLRSVAEIRKYAGLGKSCDAWVYSMGFFQHSLTPRTIGDPRRDQLAVIFNIMLLYHKAAFFSLRGVFPHPRTRSAPSIGQSTHT